MKQLAELSARLVVMSERGREFLQRDLRRRPRRRSTSFRTAFPTCRSSTRTFTRTSSASKARFVALTFGLLSPNKGIEYMLRALPAIVQKYPELRVHRSRRHASEPRPRARRDLSPQPRAAGPGSGRQEARDLLQPLRRAARADGVHRRGRHLCHALSESGPDHVRHAGLRVRLRQGRDLDALLVCRRAAGRRPRRARAVRRLRRDRQRDQRACWTTNRGVTRCASGPTCSAAK